MLGACSEPSSEPNNETTKAAEAEVAPEVTTQHDQQKILDHIRANEPTVKDVLWKQDNRLGVGVIDDGTSRDGFAQYLCTDIKDNFNASNFFISIYDIELIANSGEWVKLGETHCD